MDSLERIIFGVGLMISGAIIFATGVISVTSTDLVAYFGVVTFIIGVIYSIYNIKFEA